MTLEEIKKFFEENKDDAEVTTYIESLTKDNPLNPELVGAYLNTTEGKAIVQPMIDSRVTEAIKTHDEKQKPKVEAAIKAGITAEMLRLNPAETPEQRQIREMRQSQEEMKNEWERERLDNQITTEAAKRNIPIDIVKGIPFPSFDHAVNVMTAYEQQKQKDIEKEVNARLAVVPKPGNGKQNDNGPDFKSMSKEERFAFFKQQAEQRDAGNVAS